MNQAVGHFCFGNPVLQADEGMVFSLAKNKVHENGCV